MLLHLFMYHWLILVHALTGDRTVTSAYGEGTQPWPI